MCLLPSWHALCGQCSSSVNLEGNTMKHASFSWTAVVLCGAALMGGCDRANDDSALGEKVDSAGEQISREAAELREDTTQAMDRAGEKMESGVDRSMNSVERATDSLQDRSAAEADRLGEKVSDTAITVKAKSALIADPDLSALQINVDTDNGVVTLRGDVKSAADLNKAIDVVRAIEGVVSVDNQLKIEPAG